MQSNEQFFQGSDVRISNLLYRRLDISSAARDAIESGAEALLIRSLLP